MNEIDRWINLMESDGCRITGPRRAIVDLLLAADHAVNPIEIYDQARVKYPKMGLVTVYRTLEKLEELNLIQRVHQLDGCNCYLPQAVGHQHLIICERCGKAQFFEGENLDSFINQVGTKMGYKITQHWLQLFGICSNCAS